MKFITSKDTNKLLDQASSRHKHNRMNFESLVNTLGPDHRKTRIASRKMFNSFDIWSKALRICSEVEKYEKLLDMMKTNQVLFKSLKKRLEIGRSK